MKTAKPQDFVPGFLIRQNLRQLNVFGLQSLGTGHDLELNGLAFLQAAEALGLNRRVMDEHVVSVLPADETKTLGVVKPLHCSFFHVVILFILLYLQKSVRRLGVANADRTSG